jgi:hypothetical protein
MTSREDSERARVGLCVVCEHGRRLESAKGSVFYQCGRAAIDETYRAYPPLPVSECAGHVEKRSMAANIEDDGPR